MEHEPSTPVLDTSSMEEQRLCTCLVPIREERADYKGAARGYCASCGLPLPIRLFA